jgi:hypothetical protein
MAVFAVVMSLKPGLASADTFEVTATEWGDPADVSSMAWAVDQANKTPGKDIINIASGLKIDVGIATPAIPNAKAATLAHFTESVEIRGNGATLVGNPGFVTSAGDYATKDNIVRDVYDQAIQPTDVIVTKSYVFAQIGNYDTDNSAIEVEIQGLNGDGLIAIAKVYGGATLTIKDGRFENIVNYSTVREGVSAILAFDGSTLNLVNFELHRNFPFFSHYPSLGGDAGAVAWGGAISGSNAYLNMQDSVISESYPIGAINWSGTANIVSSVISGSGGLILEDGTLNFVNSILYLGQQGEQLTETTRVIAQGAGAKINIIASTVLYDALFTEQSGCEEKRSFSCLGSPLTATVGGIVDVRQSAVLPINLEFNVSQQPYHAREGGSFRGDDYSFIAAAGDQDSDAVRALFGNQNLITGGLAFDLINDGVTFFNPLPGGATPAPGGVLIDGVPSAGPGESNELLSPVDGQPILTDVFGNPRVRDGKRDIGAVQAGTLPSLHVVPGNGEAVLSWSRPIVPDPIIGYAVYYRPADQDVFTRVEVTGADTLKTTISGLINFQLYEFRVAAVGSNSEGAESNPQFATPYVYGPFAAPVVTATPGFHEVELNWTAPDSGNRTLFGYIVYMRKVGADQWEMATNAVLAAGPLTWKFTRLEGGTEYEFAVKALAQNGDLSPMGTDAATPLSRAAQAPAVSATPGLRSMTLDWNVPTTEEGRNICYYVILWRPDNLGSWPADNFKFTTETQIQIDGLDPAVSYQFGVAAVVEDTPGGGCTVAISGALGFVVAAPVLEPATFEVSKVYPDGSALPIEVAISCDGANPLSDTSTVAPGNPATFVLQNFISGEVTCVISENVGVAGYYPVFDDGAVRSPESCIFGNIASAGVYQCTVLNRAFPATYRVEKQWTGPVAEATGVSPMADIAIECDREMLDADAMPPSNNTGWVVSRQLTGVTASTSVTVDVSGGPASCQAREISMRPYATSSAENCGDTSLAAGASQTCTIVNAVAAPVPIMNRYGLFVLVLLTLGLGLVGMRRMT